MSKAVLLSIQPKWCDLILRGEKTIEIRKTRPKISTPFKCYIYQTKKPVEVSFSGTGKHISEYGKTYWYNERSGKIIGEFICDKIFDCDADTNGLFDRETKDYISGSCLSWTQICKYARCVLPLYGWRISDFVIYDKPKKLSDFAGMTGAPQSWRYVEEL